MTVILLYLCFVIVVTFARATLFVRFAFLLISLCCFCVPFVFFCFAFITGTFAVESELKKRPLIHRFPHSLTHNSLLGFQNSTILTNQTLLIRYSAKHFLTILHALSKGKSVPLQARGAQRVPRSYGFQIA